MTPLYKTVLAPVLLVQGLSVRRTALRLPEAAGPREGIAAHPNPQRPPLRLLVVGDSSAAGVGVEHQDHALASQTATFLAAQLQTSVAWQLVARSGVNTRQALQLLADAALHPADVVVTALGVNDVTSQRAPRQFVSDYQTLLARLRNVVGAQVAVVTGVPPLHLLPAVPQPLRWYLGQCARRLDAALLQWIRTAKHLSHVSLEWAVKPNEMARDGYHPGPGQYRRWAEVVAEHAARLLASSAVVRERAPERV